MDKTTQILLQIACGLVIAYIAGPAVLTVLPVLDAIIIANPPIIWGLCAIVAVAVIDEFWRAWRKTRKVAR